MVPDKKKQFLSLALAVFAAFLANGCSLLATRPIQTMSDTSAAIRAAKEVQADVLAPELFRQANELFFTAKREYKFKNFYLAKDYAEKARSFAEQAEFEAIRNGGNRASEPNPSAQSAPSTSASNGGKGAGADEEAPTPKPQGTPADAYEERKAAEDEAKQKAEEKAKQENEPPQPAPANSPTYFPPRKR